MRKCGATFFCSLLAWGVGLVPLPSGQLVAQDEQAPAPVEAPAESDSPLQEGAFLAIPASPSDAGLPADYVIGPEDVLDIDVFNVPELTKAVRVANDGYISLPLIGRVKAAGLTTGGLRRELEAKWSESYLQSPQVSVFVREFHARSVSVIGAVEKPGLYQLTAPRTLIEVLSMAGGLAKRSSAPAGPTLGVTRKGGFPDFQPVDGMQLVAPDKVEINIRQLLYSHNDGLNIQVKPLDIISVSKADIVYVVGAVRKPGGFVLEDRERVTIMQALAMAEGLYGSPAKASARIIRRDQNGGRTEIPVNIKNVLKGKSEDLELAANDILYIPESSGKTAVKRGMEAAVATVSGIIIFRR